MNMSFCDVLIPFPRSKVSTYPGSEGTNPRYRLNPFSQVKSFNDIMGINEYLDLVLS